VMKNFLLTVLLMVFAVARGIAQDPGFVATADRSTVGATEQFQVSFTLSGADVNSARNFKAPDFGQLVVLSGPSSSTNIQIVNGQITGSLTYSYAVYARTPGKYTIGAATVEYRGNTLRTQEGALQAKQIALADTRGRLIGLATAVADLARREQEWRDATGRRDGLKQLRQVLEDVRRNELALACPRISELASLLLEPVLDGQFRIELVTTSQTADGKKVKEDFAARILDTEAGVVRKRVSGGQTALCDEALRDAISIYRAERTGLDIQTIFRDETAGHLDPATAIEYVPMLRRLLEMTGAYQVIYVAHNPSVVREADRRIALADGSVRVE